MLMMWEMGICCFSVIVGLSMAQCISAEPWVVYLLWAVVILTFFHLFCSSSVVSWKVLPGILQKHCCILPDRNAGKDLTDVPLSTNDTTHTQCWDGKREPVCESNEQAVIPGNGDSVGGSYLSACSTSRSWPCFSHSVDLPWPHCLATNCSLYPSYIKLFFSHLTATPSNINMCQIWWGSLCVLTFSTYMPEGREKLGEQLLERVMVMGFFTSLQVWRGCWWNWRAGRYTQVPGRSFHNNDFSSTSVCVFSFNCTETACTCIPLTKAR